MPKMLKWISDVPKMGMINYGSLRGKLNGKEKILPLNGKDTKLLIFLYRPRKITGGNMESNTWSKM